MTRPYLKQNLTHSGDVKSPVGFWPNPQKEVFCLNNEAPWVVPRKWKPRGHKRSLFVDVNTGETFLEPMRIPVDENRFALLDTVPDQAPTSTAKRSRINSGSRLYGSIKDILNFNFDFNYSFSGGEMCEPDSEFNYMYYTIVDRINACSGYFVDLIDLGKPELNNYTGTVNESNSNLDNLNIANNFESFNNKPHNKTHKFKALNTIGNIDSNNNRSCTQNILNIKQVASSNSTYNVGYIRKS